MQWQMHKGPSRIDSGKFQSQGIYINFKWQVKEC